MYIHGEAREFRVPALRRSAAIRRSKAPAHPVRDAHRAFQKPWEKRIAAHGITRGQWYFLRVLWIEDGPFAARALRARRHDGADHRDRAAQHGEGRPHSPRASKRGQALVANVWLTAKAKRIREQMLLLARGINEDACHGLSREEFDIFRRAITHMTENLDCVMR